MLRRHFSCRRTLLQGTDAFAKVESFPDGHADVQQSHAGDRAADPAGGDKILQAIKAGFARGQHEKIIIAPVAEAEQTLGNPWQAGQQKPNLETKDDVKDY
jgi:hypothetical protein